MARPKRGDGIDLSTAHQLSVGLIDRLTCPPGLVKAFLRDRDLAGLKVRVTDNGAKAFVYEAKLNGKAISKTLGKFPLMSIDEARAAAHALAKTVKTDKLDPRELAREAKAQKAQEEATATAQRLTVGELWPTYLAEGRPKRRDAWKPGYREGLEAAVTPGGVKKKRGKGLTRPGPLFPLMALPLSDITEDTLTAWYDREARTSKHQAARALMMFRGFLRWTSARPEYRRLVDRDAGKAPAIMENLPAIKKRTDALGAAQVAPWWTAVDRLDNRTASVYLRALLLTGARRDELAALTWANVDFQWRRVTIADKVEDSRVIPLTPYLAHLLASLPRQSKFVFASAGKTGRITDVRSCHTKALKMAGIEYLTFHGLRRSFIQRARSVVPAGVPAQISGHKPSATAEGYAVLSLDDLTPYAEQVEAHILTLAGVTFDREAAKTGLRAVA